MWKSIVYTLLFLGMSCVAHAHFTQLPDSIIPEQFFDDQELGELTDDTAVVTVDQLENIVEELNRSKLSRDKRIKIWFVDNTNPRSGDGSFKNPFNTLVAAQQASKSGQIIFVFPGNNTTKGMNQGFIMKNGQRLLGAGIHHRIDFPEKKLIVRAPSTTLPRITNTNGSVIILANSCEVSGMNIVNINRADGILGGDPNPDGPFILGVKNTLIQKNVIGTLGLVDHNIVVNGAIYLPNCRGNLVIQKNYIYNIIGAIENIDQGQGIRLHNRNLPVSSHVTINKNIVSNISATGIALLHNSPRGKVQALVKDNIVFNIGQKGNGFSTGTDRPDAGGLLCIKIMRNFCQNINAGVNLFLSSSGTAHVKAQVIDNLLARSALLDTGMFLPGFSSGSFDNSRLCLKLVKNFSEFGYELHQFDKSTFKLEPLRKNLGLPFTISGKIQRACAGACSCEAPREPKKPRVPRKPTQCGCRD